MSHVFLHLIIFYQLLKKNYQKKSIIIDFECGKVRVIDYFKSQSFITRLIGIEINKQVKIVLHF
jgi:hypothetical protein